jgi:hypothetical protein
VQAESSVFIVAFDPNNPSTIVGSLYLHWEIEDNNDNTEFKVS